MIRAEAYQARQDNANRVYEYIRILLRLYRLLKWPYCKDVVRNGHTSLYRSEDALTTGNDIQYAKLYATNSHEPSDRRSNSDATELNVDIIIASSALARKAPIAVRLLLMDGNRVGPTKENPVNDWSI